MVWNKKVISFLVSRRKRRVQTLCDQKKIDGLCSQIPAMKTQVEYPNMCVLGNIFKLAYYQLVCTPFN